MTDTDVDHKTIFKKINEMAKAHEEAHARIEGKVDANAASIGALDGKWTSHLDRIEKKTDQNTEVINQAKGGLSVGKWIFGTLVAVASAIGLADFLQHK